MTKYINANELKEKFREAKMLHETHLSDFSESFFNLSGELSTEWWCVEDMLDNTTSADVRENTYAVWLLRVVDEDDNSCIYECSACGYLFRLPCGYKPYEWQLNYCPCCGADMRGDE